MRMGRNANEGNETTKYLVDSFLPCYMRQIATKGVNRRLYKCELHQHTQLGTQFAPFFLMFRCRLKSKFKEAVLCAVAVDKAVGIHEPELQKLFGQG